MQAAFSKRRMGLLKKAYELCMFCGVEVAMMVFSRVDKVFSFCHSQVDVIIDRFLAENPTRTFSSPTQRSGSS